MKCNPIVYAVENYYQIFIITENSTMVWVNVGGEEYYDAEAFMRELDRMNPRVAPEPIRETKKRHTRATKVKSDGPKRRSVKYQNFDDFLDENIAPNNNGQQYEPLSLDDIFGGDKK